MDPQHDAVGVGVVCYAGVAANSPLHASNSAPSVWRQKKLRFAGDKRVLRFEVHAMHATILYLEGPLNCCETFGGGVAHEIFCDKSIKTGCNKPWEAKVAVLGEEHKIARSSHHRDKCVEFHPLDLGVVGCAATNDT